MKNLIPTRIPVIIYALIILFFGVNHVMHAGNMTGAVPSMFPNPKIWVYITGIAFILAAIAFIINRFAKAAGYLLALLLLIIVFTVHLPAMMHATDEAGKLMPMINILKDTGLAMAAIIIANISRQ